MQRSTKAHNAQNKRTGLPMVVLMCSDLTFCQFFLSRETKKLMPEGREMTVNRRAAM